jgi:hypothetical protein
MIVLYKLYQSYWWYLENQIFNFRFKINWFLFTYSSIRVLDIYDIFNNYKNKMEIIDKINIKKSDIIQNEKLNFVSNNIL